MRIPVKKVGDLCRHCKTPVILKESRFRKEKLNKPYYYTAYLLCPYCRAMYMQDEFKVINQERIAKKIRARDRLRYSQIQGPITKEKYRLYRESPIWQNRKKTFWETHKKVCYCCEGVATEIHHNKYENIGREKNRDLVPLCRDCHQAVTDMVIRKEAKLINAHVIYRQLLALKI